MLEGSAVTYRVFVRDWWKWEARNAFPGDRERKLAPNPGARKTTIGRRMTEDEARAMCEEYARTHKPGPLSRKAEYERE